MVELSQFNILGQQFEQDRLSQESLFKTLRGSVKSLRTQNLAAELATPRISEKQRQSAMIRLMTVNPEVGQIVAGAMQRGDTRVLAKQQRAAEKLTKLSAFYSTFDTTEEGGKAKLIAQIRRDAHEALANRDFRAAQELFDLASMTPGNRKTEIVKQGIVGKDVTTATKSAQDIISKREQEELNIARNILALPEADRLPAIAQLEQDAAAKGNTALAAKLNRIRSRPEELTSILQAVINRAEPTAPGKDFTLSPDQQRFGPGGEPIASVPAAPAKPIGPTSKIAIGRAELKAGLITQDDFDALSKLKDGDSVKLGPDVITKVGEKFFFAQQVIDAKGDGKAVLTEIPGSPVNPRTGLSLAEEESTKAKGAGEKVTEELRAEAKGRPHVISAEIKAKGIGERAQQAIIGGVEAAEGIPQLRRVLDLLEVVETGGIEAAQLAIENTLGITTADKTELQNALLVEILKQIKPIFGGQPSERETATLLEINQNFGKSTAGNKRLINKVIELAKVRVAIGLTDARIAGDQRAIDRMTDGLNLILSLEKPGASPKGKPKPAANKLRSFNPETGLFE